MAFQVLTEAEKSTPSGAEGPGREARKLKSSPSLKLTTYPACRPEPVFMDPSTPHEMAANYSTLKWRSVTDSLGLSATVCSDFMEIKRIQS